MKLYRRFLFSLYCVRCFQASWSLFWVFKFPYWSQLCQFLPLNFQRFSEMAPASWSCCCSCFTLSGHSSCSDISHWGNQVEPLNYKQPRGISGHGCAFVCVCGGCGWYTVVSTCTVVTPGGIHQSVGGGGREDIANTPHPQHTPSPFTASHYTAGSQLKEIGIYHHMLHQYHTLLLPLYTTNITTIHHHYHNHTPPPTLSYRSTTIHLHYDHTPPHTPCPYTTTTTL